MLVSNIKIPHYHILIFQPVMLLVTHLIVYGMLQIYFTLILQKDMMLELLLVIMLEIVILQQFQCIML